MNNTNVVTANCAHIGFVVNVGAGAHGSDFNNHAASLVLAEANATNYSSFIVPMFGVNGGVLNVPQNGTTFNSWLSDYRLASASPLKGAGVSNAGGITTDILGKARNSPDDIGCIAYGH